MRTGFLMVPRAVLESWWWKAATPFTRNLWLLLMALANFAQGTTKRGETLRPGQLVTSWTALAEHLAWSERGVRKVPGRMKVRNGATFLRTAGEATWKTTGIATGAGVLITLERWPLYATGHSEATDLATQDRTDGSVTPPTTLEEVKGPVAPQQNTWLRRHLAEWEQAEREGWEAH